MKKMPLDDQHIYVSALRYALGRHTYITRLTADSIIRHIKEFDESTLRIMVNDLDGYFDGFLDKNDTDFVIWTELAKAVYKQLLEV